MEYNTPTSVSVSLGCYNQMPQEGLKPQIMVSPSSGDPKSKIKVQTTSSLLHPHILERGCLVSAPLLLRAQTPHRGSSGLPTALSSQHWPTENRADTHDSGEGA